MSGIFGKKHFDPPPPPKVTTHRETVRIVGPDGGVPINLKGELQSDWGPVTLVGFPIAAGVLCIDVQPQASGIGGNFSAICDGAQPFRCRAITHHETGALELRDAHDQVIPQPIQLQPLVKPWPPLNPLPMPPITPFDPDEPNNHVHTTLPPEQVIPTTRDPLWWRGDIGGVMLAETPPFVKKGTDGANTTPPEMVMSYFLDVYPPEWQQKILEAHYRRGYTHFVITRPADTSDAGWDRFGALCQEIRRWGQYVCYWDDDVTAITRMLAMGAMDVLILGGELNSHHSPDELMTLIKIATDRCRPLGVPVWLHFTANVPTWQRNDENDIAWVIKVVALGIVGLCWQGNQDESAGVMSARLWDARQRWGRAGAPVVAFELLSTNQLYGKATETDGRRRGYEMVCATRDGKDWVPPVAGYGSGGARPDGSVL